ncbi:uncharacterized protein LOC113239253 [Hyposmocoma kahamanoa]|uniref:uncharacterized protein LOC113239253 n=1 Tax=Hyposmocoma kahamanoa TaxID=1477025 RepID=UPI000E6D7B9A|nr:uncharacterized protein LOC113239253 [Hyposmocoma kahamanoa]
MVWVACPRLQDGLLVLDLRIKALPNEDEHTKNRILLDDRHRVICLLIANLHNKASHGFHEYVLNDLREHFWVLRGRRAARAVAAECFERKRRKSSPRCPRDLPPERLLHHTRPFTNVCLDNFGLYRSADAVKRVSRDEN